MTRKRIKSTARMARIYGPDDPRSERNARLGAIRERRTEDAVAEVRAALAAAQEEPEPGLAFTDMCGTSFPEAPIDGQPFVRTDLDCDLFKWDETRQKWLSTVEAVPTFTNGTTLLSGFSLRLFQGPTGSGTLGYDLQWDCTLTDVVSTRATSGAATQFDIRAATTVRHSHTLGAGVVTAEEPALDVDFSAGEIVNVILASDMTGGGTCTVRLRRRAS